MAVRDDIIVQTTNLTDDDFKFKSPFVMCVSGATMSGKSEFIVKLLNHKEKMFNVNFDHVFYCAPESLVLRPNPIFSKIKQSVPNALLVSGLPDVAKLNLTLDYSNKLVIIDDLMDSFLNSQEMVDFLSIDCHHFKISTIFVVQNFFHQSKFGKSLNRNVNYRCLFYNRLDLTEIRTISVQVSHKPKFLFESFEFLRKEFPNEPSYLILDGHGASPCRDLYVRSHIFPDSDGEIRPIIFFPK